MNWGECWCCFFLEKKNIGNLLLQILDKDEKEKKKNTKKLKLNYNRVGAMIGQKKKKKKKKTKKAGIQL